MATINPVFQLKRENGRSFYARNRLKNYISSLSDGTYNIIIRKESKKRTLPQNSYYWGVIVEIVRKEWGWSREEVHEAFKMRFLLIPGENGMPDRIGSTRNLSTVEFKEYINQITQWLWDDFQIVIPEPGEISLDGEVYY